MRSTQSIKANDFEKNFDEGTSVIAHADMSKASRPNKVEQIADFDFKNDKTMRTKDTESKR